MVIYGSVDMSRTVTMEKRALMQKPFTPTKMMCARFFRVPWQRCLSTSIEGY